MTAALQALTVARTQLVLKQPFFGMLALRLRLVESTTLEHGTMAVDGQNLFYDPHFVLRCSKPRLQAAVAHEVVHCAMEHLARQGARDPKLWNMAIDYADNGLLVEAGLDVDKEHWLYDPKLANMSAEEIYNLLRNSSEGEDKGRGGKPFDDHLPAPATAENEWRTAVVQAAQAAQAAGKLPGCLKRLVDTLLQPQLGWREVLARFMHSSAGKADTTWMRPQRRMLPHGLVLPSMFSESMGTVVAVSDDSGSINDKILQALASEIDGIRISTEPEKLVHISCDARINHVAEFGPHDEFKMVSNGGGGTDFRPPFKHVAEQQLQPACLIYLTDGYGPFPSEPPPYPVLWCMTTDVKPPFGECVRIEV